MKRAWAVAVGLGVIAGLTLAISGVTAGTSGRFDKHRVKVFFTTEDSLDNTCKVTKASSRLTRGADVLHDSMNWLVRGPRRADRKDGLTSFFSRRTAGMVNSVRVSNGTAYIDFDDFRRIISGASSSCGSASLMSELTRTAKQFSTVDRVVFSFEGSVRAFYNWLQLDPPGR